MRAFITSLVVAFVVLSGLAGGGLATQRVMTGTVAEYEPGERMLVTNEGMRVEVIFREATVSEGRITSGVRVTVWFRYLAERRPVADRVRVLTAL